MIGKRHLDTSGNMDEILTPFWPLGWAQGALSGDVMSGTV